jgi:hypothetical protein
MKPRNDGYSLTLAYGRPRIEGATAFVATSETPRIDASRSSDRHMRDVNIGMHVAAPLFAGRMPPAPFHTLSAEPGIFFCIASHFPQDSAGDFPTKNALPSLTVALLTAAVRPCVTLLDDFEALTQIISICRSSAAEIGNKPDTVRRGDETGGMPAIVRRRRQLGTMQPVLRCWCLIL